MEAKHTRGPWKLERLTGDNGIGIRVTGPVVSGYTAFIRTRWAHENQRIEQEANAQLIAAAPDLLDALHEARRAIGDHCAPNDCYATGPMTGDSIRDLVQCPACSAIAMYDAAIAKATGSAA